MRPGGQIPGLRGSIHPPWSPSTSRMSHARRGFAGESSRIRRVGLPGGRPGSRCLQQAISLLPIPQVNAADPLSGDNGAGALGAKPHRHVPLLIRPRGCGMQVPVAARSFDQSRCIAPWPCAGPDNLVAARPIDPGYVDGVIFCAFSLVYRYLASACPLCRCQTSSSSFDAGSQQKR